MVVFCRSRKPSAPDIIQAEEGDSSDNLEVQIKNKLNWSRHNVNALFRKGPPQETEIIQCVQQATEETAILV